MAGGFNVSPLPRMTRWEAGEQRQIERVAERSTNAPRIPWDKFRLRLTWASGEHVGLIGPTGQGKTTLMLHLLPLHPFVTIFGTKPKDRVLDALIRNGGYLRMDRWRSIDPLQFPRRILWPDARKLNSTDVQRRVFGEAFEAIYIEGHWTLAIDETYWFTDVLKMDTYIKTYLLQGRSMDISLLANMQRPAWVPREIYTSATHLFFYRTNDRNDLQSLSGIGWRDADLIRSTVANLEAFQFLYVNTRTGEMCRSHCPEVRI